MPYTYDQIDEGTRRQVRRALSGQEDEPVRLETSGPDEAGRPPAPEVPARVSAAEIAHELQREDPRLLEVLAGRVLIRKLQQALEGQGGGPAGPQTGA